jgi:heat shock protein HslJ
VESANAARLRQAAALTIRLFTLSLLLIAVACRAEPQRIEGMYRYGHEVNTVCTGEPETCYWLVDTDAETRQQLKRQVRGLAPYMPVCLTLLAELSAHKTDGFGLDYDGSIRVVKLLGPCAKAAAEPVSLEDLRHRRWLLHSVGGLELDDLARARGYADDASLQRVPELDFGEQDFVAGNSGCNRFQGRADVVEGELLLTLVPLTELSCDGFSRELELELLLLYRNPLAVSREGNELILEGAGGKLRLRLRDWVQ